MVYKVDRALTEDYILLNVADNSFLEMEMIYL